MSQTIHPPPVPRFTAIVELMCKAVACRGGPRPIGLSGLPVEGLSGQLLILIWTRLRRIIARFTRAATTPQAPIRIRARRAAKPRPVEPLGLPRLSLPRQYAWLLKMIQETAVGASQLRYFLNDPEVAAMIAADPRLGRILRPLCHMLGMPRDYTPALWPPPPNPPPQPSPQPPDAPPAASPVPIHGHAPPRKRYKPRLRFGQPRFGQPRFGQHPYLTPRHPPPRLPFFRKP